MLLFCRRRAVVGGVSSWWAIDVGEAEQDEDAESESQRRRAAASGPTRPVHCLCEAGTAVSKLLRLEAPRVRAAGDQRGRNLPPALRRRQILYPSLTTALDSDFGARVHRWLLRDASSRSVGRVVMPLSTFEIVSW